MSTTLHYIYDPLCGWCYAAEPLAKAAMQVDSVALALHAGGLWPEPTHLPDDMRRYIQQADARAGAMTGQPYGEAYLNGLLLDPTLVLESRPPIAAILAVQAIDESNGFAMLERIQHAHYERGLKVVEADVLAMLAGELGLDTESYANALMAVDVDAHIAESRRLMTRAGSAGFPTFVLQQDEQWSTVPHQRFSSDPSAFAVWLGN